MPITALYAGLLAPLFVLLSARVIVLRRGAHAVFGDGGSPDLLRRMRVQGNFAEYAPLGLVLLGLAESVHTPSLLVHLLGLTLLAGRCAHAYGVSQTPENFRFRVGGMILTLGMLLCSALICLVSAVLQIG